VDAGAVEDGCPAGRRVLTVQADGRLRGCSCLPGAASAESLHEVADAARLGNDLRVEATTRERRLRERLRAAGWPVAGGFCHALASRVPAVDVPGAAGEARRFASPAKGGLALGTMLLAGLISCGPSRSGTDGTPTTPDSPEGSMTTPVENAPPPVEPTVEADTKTPPGSTGTADGTPAGTAPGQSTTNVVAPSTDRPSMKPEPWVMPRCCMMHILVPDCKCSPPAGSMPTP
jgi:hypothetical protein